MQFVNRELPPIGTNAVVIIEPQKKACLVVDAPAGAYDWAVGVANEAGCSIDALLLTHGHWDHILDGHRFAEAGIPIYGHRADAVLFEAPSRMAAYAMPGVRLEPVPIDHWLAAGEELHLLGQSIEVRHVPGHCPGNVLFYLASEGVAIVGDAIFAGSVGRHDLPGGSFHELEQSIREQIYTLPEATCIYPGHGPTTSVGREMRHNAFVKA